MKALHRLGLVYIDLRRWCGRRCCNRYEQRSCRVQPGERKNACTKARHSIPNATTASTIDSAGLVPTQCRVSAAKRAAVMVTLF
jgi:hypothetical protein